MAAKLAPFYKNTSNWPNKQEIWTEIASHRKKVTSVDPIMCSIFSNNKATLTNWALHMDQRVQMAPSFRKLPQFDSKQMEQN